LILGLFKVAIRVPFAGIPAHTSSALGCNGDSDGGRKRLWLLSNRLPRRRLDPPVHWAVSSEFLLLAALILTARRLFLMTHPDC
jgi:hypothetical protein